MVGSIKTLFAAYKTRIIIAITAISIIGVAGAVKWYGIKEYRRGVEQCTSDQKTAVITTIKTDSQIWKDVRHENSKIVDLDNAGAVLGILRPDELR